MSLSNRIKNLKLLLVCSALSICWQTSTTHCIDGLPLYYKNEVEKIYRITNGLTLYYWKEKFINFGDYLSLKLVERIVNGPVQEYQKDPLAREPKLLAIGSIMTFARNHDVIWGSGVNGKWLDLKHYKFTALDIRAVRGPLTRHFLMKNFAIPCPEIYGDPALLIPYFFPEFKRKEHPTYEYLIIPHYSEQHLFPKNIYPNVVYPTEPWDVVINKILDSKLVLSSSLHGIIVAEAFNIPARFLRISNHEAMFKYIDYYLGTGRPEFQLAYSIEEALHMGGEKPLQINLRKLYEAFPFEFWPQASFLNPSIITQGS